MQDRKVEQTLQGSGKYLGIDMVDVFTLVGTRQPDGVIVLEGVGIATTRDGDSVAIKTWGVRQPTGAGLRARSLGFDIWQTASQNFARLNNTTYVWQTEFDETGTYHLKLWEWK